MQIACKKTLTLESVVINDKCAAGGGERDEGKIVNPEPKIPEGNGRRLHDGDVVKQ